MRSICNRQCFRCKHPDCINDEPPSLKEIAIIEADNRYVQWSRLTAEEKRKREVWKAYRKTYQAKHKAEIDAKRLANKQRAYERTINWRKKRREGAAI